MSGGCPYCAQDGRNGCPIHVRRATILYTAAVIVAALVCLTALTVAAIAA